MPSQSDTPQSPYAVPVVRTGDEGAPAFVGPYTDPALTSKNPPAAVITPTPAKAGSTTLGEITVYDVTGTDHAPGDQGATAPAHAPNSWRPGRDPYANGGMTGQTFFPNQG